MARPKLKRGFYRGGVIFAALPDKRALRVADAIAYKFPSDQGKSEIDKWRCFVLTDIAQSSAALKLLDEAYRRAAPRSRKP